MHVAPTKVDPGSHSQDDWETALTGDLKIRISMAKRQAPEADCTTLETAFPKSTDQETSLSPTLLALQAL